MARPFTHPRHGHTCKCHLFHRLRLASLKSSKPSQQPCQRYLRPFDCWLDSSSSGSFRDIAHRNVPNTYASDLPPRFRRLQTNASRSSRYGEISGLYFFMERSDTYHVARRPFQRYILVGLRSHTQLSDRCSGPPAGTDIRSAEKPYTPTKPLKK